MPKRRYRSKIAAAVHESMHDLYEIGLMDAETMRDFDRSCLTCVEPLAPEEIARVRRDAGVSQAVFANYLNVSPGIVSKWERGEKKPNGSSLKLITLVKEKGIEWIK